MFALFFSLYVSMFTGTWYAFSLNGIELALKPVLNIIGELITSLFNDVSTPVTNLGDVMTSSYGGIANNYIILVAFILALITCTGIVVMAVKGVKKAFGIFFMGIR